MGAPRSFHVPHALCTPTFGPKVTLDDLEPIAASSSPAAPWAAHLLAVENGKTLDELLGEDTRLPRGLLAGIGHNDGDELITGLVNHRSEMWDPKFGWQPAPPGAIGDTLDLSDADVAFVARALAEGANSVVMRSSIPLAFISAAAPPSKGSAAAGLVELPDGAVVVAIVDSVDKDAVLEMLAVAPGPKAYRRHDGAWQEDPAWIQVLASVRPPTMVKLEPAQIEGVASQVDEATTGQKFEVFKESQRERYQVTASAYVAELQAEALQSAVDLNLALVAVAGRQLTPKDAASTEKLRRYWLYGKGAAKIRWGTPGAWRRCYRNLVKHLGPRMTPGYCTNLSKRLGGPGVATHVGSKH